MVNAGKKRVPKIFKKLKLGRTAGGLFGGRHGELGYALDMPMKLNWTEPEVYRGQRRLTADDKIVEDFKVVRTGALGPEASWTVSYRNRPIGQTRIAGG